MLRGGLCRQQGLTHWRQETVGLHAGAPFHERLVGGTAAVVEPLACPAAKFGYQQGQGLAVSPLVEHRLQPLLRRGGGEPRGLSLTHEAVGFICQAETVHEGGEFRAPLGRDGIAAEAQRGLPACRVESVAWFGFLRCPVGEGSIQPPPRLLGNRQIQRLHRLLARRSKVTALLRP